MKYLILLLFPLALMSDVHQEPNPKNAFFYANFGGYYAGYDVKGIDIGLGYRRIYGSSAFDINAGGSLIDPIVPFAQGSYLFYPFKWNGPYLGAGISVIPIPLIGEDLPVLANLPLILGYQTPNKAHPVFVQVQYSPLMIPGTTISVGIGF